MQIKSFSAHTSKEVLTLIKEELGPDAVILDSQEEGGLITMTAALERAPASSAYAAVTVAPGSSSGFEPLGGRPARFHIPRQTAAFPTFSPGNAADAEQEAGPAHPARGRARLQSGNTPAPAAEAGPGEQGVLQPEAARARKQQDALSAARPAPQHITGSSSGARPLRQPAQAGPCDPPPPGWHRWHEEWSSIKDHLLALMKPDPRLDMLPPRQRLALEFLQREGVEDSAVLHLFQRLQADPEASILAHLARLVPVRTWSLEGWPQRLQMVSGPFGAGKTSVAIRLALSLRRASPACRICMINADATRGSGRLLLRHYCDLSDMAYKEAATTLELVAALNEALRKNYDRIFVDLPGFSRGRRLDTLVADAGLAELSGEGPNDLAVHLTLPPHYGSPQLRGMLERYRVPHACSIVWTKLDEVEHYGQIVNVAVSTGLPVSALSFGPGLGNSLAPIRENMLWRLLFKQELPAGT